jgi:hypothetical protein
MGRAGLIAWSLALVLGGCGRSSLLGDGASCPAGGICIPGGARDLAGVDLAGGDGGDGGGDFCGDPSHCQDPRCVGDPRCHVPGTEICNNCIDDNDNGLVDCADPQCAGFPGCQPGHMCNPQMVDCADPQCACGPLCQDQRCMPTVDFGTLNPTGSSSTRMIDTTGTKDVTTTPCAPGGAGMVVGKFTVTGVAAVVLSFTQGKGEDHVFGIFAAGTNQPCGANPIENACYDPKSAASGSHTYLIPQAGEYYVIAQPFEPAGQGPLTVTLSTGCPQQEICNNGVDDNCNGLVDCADPQCFTDPGCAKQECIPDLNVGALVVDAPGKMVSFDTTSADVENNLTCEAAQGGKDVVVRFTLKQQAGIELQWDQTGDHVVGLMQTPAPGAPCDFNQLSCYDPSGRKQDTVAWTDQPPGDYLLIFKSTRPGDEGHIDATISAFSDRVVTCNPPDNCSDPSCHGVNGCTGPYCMPDVQLGQMAIGDSRTVNLDVAANGITGYKASCAKGGGKGLVVQLDIPAGGTLGGAGIGFDCTETGDHVLDLFAQTAPRDLCDTNERVCADPKSLPFGCGYEVPNLSPGIYNVIVEGYQAGSEGTVDLTLTIVDDRQIVDCSQPGACSNRQCYTSQYCTGAQCKAAQTIDPMPLDGSQVFALVQTAGAASHSTLPCATFPGGNTQAIQLYLTAAADLTLGWQQIGNHDFALYSDLGAVAPCDAGTLVQCGKSGGLNQSGTLSWSNVPQGRYWLVVGADGPDGGDMGQQLSGSVDVALSGKPHM